MKKVLLVAAAAVVGVLAALTYFLFEAVVRTSIQFVWEDWLASDMQRLLVLPICFVLTLIYFGVQHYLDPKSEKHQTHGLGTMPTPTLGNYGKILLIGFLSLLAGAALGPEAILVPACMIVGGYVGVKLFNKSKEATAILSAAGFVALFAAFFNSFLVGLLGILLIQKQTKAKLSLLAIVSAVVASGASVITLALVKGHGFFSFPPLDWSLNFLSVLGLVIVLVIGFGTTFLLGGMHTGFTKLYGPYLADKPWWAHALIAAAGLSALYLIGGSMIQFTGNESILPLITQAGGMGVAALLLIFVTKVAAIAWSKALGYRGGLVFPSVFVVVTLVMLVHVIIPINIVYGIVIGLVGMLIADRWVKILV